MFFYIDPCWFVVLNLFDQEEHVILLKEDFARFLGDGGLIVWEKVRWQFHNDCGKNIFCAKWEVEASPNDFDIESYFQWSFLWCLLAQERFWKQPPGGLGCVYFHKTIPHKKIHHRKCPEKVLLIIFIIILSVLKFNLVPKCNFPKVSFSSREDEDGITQESLEGLEVWIAHCVKNNNNETKRSISFEQFWLLITFYNHIFSSPISLTIPLLGYMLSWLLASSPPSSRPEGVISCLSTLLSWA